MAQRPQSTGSGILIGRAFGIPIYLHTSWFIIFALITLSLSQQFRSQHPHWSNAEHWWLGILTSVLFFASVLFHELSHSVVAKSYRIPVKSITLFVFGGLAKISRDPDNARQEINIAIAGPISSFFLAGCFWLIERYARGGEMVFSAARWLALINLLLALFNLVPGFPLDGGRILRGIVWAITGNFVRATSIAARAGQAFAFFMILLGVWQALTGKWIDGLWTAFIGWFLLSAAQESFLQVAFRDGLVGVKAVDIMSKDIPTVTRDMSIEEYFQEVLRTGRRCHIVTGSGAPVGLITLQSTRSVPRDEWTNTSIQAVMLPLDRVHWAVPDEPAVAILQRMQSEDVNQMPVISDGNIVGIIARDTILKVLQTRLQLHRLSEQ